MNRKNEEIWFEDNSAMQYHFYQPSSIIIIITIYKASKVTIHISLSRGITLYYIHT
jgi:hypothetical protein